MPDSGRRLAVVIPYFQRRPGLLRAAVGSVLAHRGQFDVTVFVVDDSSPHPAIQEIDAALLQNQRVILLHQANAGPSAARNRGLDAVPADTEYVAFLDSDDQWTDSFLRDATAAFETGADFFFSDTVRFNEAQSRFDWSEDCRYRLSGIGHVPLADSSTVFTFVGDFFGFLVRRSNIVGSSFAFRVTAANGVRFDTRLTYGEDRLFKLGLASNCAQVAFSTATGCIEGPGVNIFDLASPGSSRSLRLTSDYVLLNLLLLRRLALTTEQRRWLMSELRRCRCDWVRNVICALRNRTPGVTSSLALTLRRDPCLPLAMLRDRLGPAPH